MTLFLSRLLAKAKCVGATGESFIQKGIKGYNKRSCELGCKLDYGEPLLNGILAVPVSVIP